MLKWIFNSETYNKAGNSVFELINRYFISAPITNFMGSEKESQSVKDQDYSYTCEWELHQDVSDIVIKDIKLSFRWLVSPSLIETLIKVNRRIKLYFFLDELEDEIISERGAKIPTVHGLYSKVITIAVDTTIKIQDNVIYFNDWFRELVHKLEIFLNIREEEKTYYLIGNFSPRVHDLSASCYAQSARGPDPSKLRSYIPFYKRN
jgi:hypothetical protein